MESIAEKEILPVLLRLGRHMLVNRATKMETLAYLAYLCCRGSRGGSLSAETGTPLDAAIKTFDFLWRFISNGKDSDVDYSEIERKFFIQAPYSPDDYIDAFHLLPHEYLTNLIHHQSPGVVMQDAEITPAIFDQTCCHGVFLNLSSKVITSLPPGQKILDLAPCLLPFQFSFTPFKHYVMVEEDRIRRALLVLMKEIEGESWKTVDILASVPEDESFDCVRIQYPECPVDEDFRLTDRLEGISVEKGGIVIWGLANNLLATDIVSRVSHPDPGHETTFHLDTVLQYHRDKPIPLPCLVFKDSSQGCDAVTFASFERKLQQKDLSLDWESGFIRNALSHKEDESVLTVTKSDLMKDSLNPSFYLLRREKRLEKGTVSLYEICRWSQVGRWQRGPERAEGLTIQFFSITDNASRLLELSPVVRTLCSRGSLLTGNAILLRFPSMGLMFQHLAYACLLKVEPGSRVVIPESIVPVVVDTKRFDPRYIAMIVNRISDKQLSLFFNTTRFASLDLIRIPDISIDEQKKAVEEYLQEFRNTLPGSVREDSGVVPYSVLVVTHDRDSFERRFGAQLEQAQLNVIGYASDSRSLEETIPKHFGKDVPVSRRVDAVLADITSPDGDTDFVLYRLHDLDVRKFYYSGDGDPSGRIHPIFREEVLSGLIAGDDPASGMRRVLDTQMSPAARIREEYREFFQAAGRLDRLYPDWGLVDTVTGYLLAGKTKTPVNNVRSLLSETLCQFFKDRHAVPWCMEDGAIPSFLADGSYYDKNSRLQFKVADGKTPKSEAWLRYAFVTLFKLGNKESHVSRETEEMVSEAALIILMQVIIWFEGVHDRYAEGKVGFRCFRKDRECAASVVREAAPGYFVVGDVHIGNQDGLRDGTVGILEEQLPPEKNPRTIDGVTYARYADKDRFHILVP